MGATEQVLKRLFALSRNRCAYPDCTTAIVQQSGTLTGDICHIKAQSPGGPRYDATQTAEERHGFDNLILLCKVHHAIVDDQPKTFKFELLKEMKEMHERGGSILMSPDDARLARRLLDSFLHIQASGEAQVMVASPGAVQAKNITIKTTKKKVIFQPPADAIGSCLTMKNYIAHLIERYNEFQKAHTEKTGRGKYVVLHNAIRRAFGSKWDAVPQGKFNDLVAFLHYRIDNTKMGRILRSRGQPRYSTYEQFLAKYHNYGQ
jgi:hypothetical protein